MSDQEQKAAPGIAWGQLLEEASRTYVFAEREIEIASPRTIAEIADGHVGNERVDGASRHLLHLFNDERLVLHDENPKAGD